MRPSFDHVGLQTLVAPVGEGHGIATRGPNRPESGQLRAAPTSFQIREPPAVGTDAEIPVHQRFVRGQSDPGRLQGVELEIDHDVAVGFLGRDEQSGASWDHCGALQLRLAGAGQLENFRGLPPSAGTT